MKTTATRVVLMLRRAVPAVFSLLLWMLVHPAPPVRASGISTRTQICPNPNGVAQTDLNAFAYCVFTSSAQDTQHFSSASGLVSFDASVKVTAGFTTLGVFTTANVSN